MVLGGTHPSLSSPHSDVLTATPTDTPAKLRLVEEIKSRGKSCVLAKNWPDADRLYTKGIELLESIADGDTDSNSNTNTNADLAVLHSNRSLALFHLTQLTESRSAATTAVELDPSYVKGYWRLGQACAAMSDWNDALSAYEGALKVDGEQGGKMVKALTKEVEKCSVKVEQERLLVMEGKFDGGADGSSNKSEPAKKPKPVVSKPAAPRPAASSSSSKKADIVKADGEDGEFSTSDHVRGYKIVNGKKTSFFHHEMTEEEKKLIGDIAPKKLDDASATNPATAGAPAVEGASAWNKAGTWEEKDITKWAADTLSSTLLTCSYDIPDTNQSVKVVKAKKMDVHDGGHASVAAVRGKKRYIYEFGYEIEWELSSSGGDADVELKGKLVLPDIDGTVASGEWHDVSDFTVVGGIPNAKRAFLMKHVRDGGLRQVIEDKIDGWVVLLKATY